MSITGFEEDTVTAGDDVDSVFIDEPEKKTENSGEGFGRFIGFFAIGGVLLIVASMIAAIAWLMFAPSPSANTQEAADIIRDDISSSMITANAYRVVNNEETGASVLTVETEEGTCKTFRSLPGGVYQAFESEGRVSPSYLDFEPVNYRRAFPSDMSSPVFQYHHSEEQLQHGVFVNMVTGFELNLDPRAAIIADQYPANLNVESESFCF